ncbi:MAG: hypothetical protein RXO24_05640, partial [Acidilobus sp.]
ATCRWAVPRRTPRALPRATQLNTQLYGYSLMKSRNLCMEWLRTVPSYGAACSHAGPVQRSVRVCRTLGGCQGPKSL